VVGGWDEERGLKESNTSHETILVLLHCLTQRVEVKVVVGRNVCNEATSSFFHIHLGRATERKPGPRGGEAPVG
jgi:hypothetical protein